MLRPLISDYFHQDVLTVAPALIGKYIVTGGPDGQVKMITETEAYRGEEDEACHARKGRTLRTEIMYAPGGHIYMYLIYGKHWMLNVVTGDIDHPQAVLIRACEGCRGPGIVTRELGIDGRYNKKLLGKETGLLITDGIEEVKIVCGKRVGIDYASDEWRNKSWRYTKV